MTCKPYLFTLLVVILAGSALFGCRTAVTEEQTPKGLSGQSRRLPAGAEPAASSTPLLSPTPTATSNTVPASTATLVKTQPAGRPSTARTPIPPTSASDTGGQGTLQAEETSSKTFLGVLSFTASSSRVNPGEVVTLSWEVTGPKAEMGECLYPDDGHLSHPCFPKTYAVVPLVGTRTVTIPKEARYSVLFMLNVQNDSGSLLDHESIYLEISCPTTWFFGSAPAEYGTTCPQDEVVTSQAAWQTFEHGSMMWNARTNEILVLLANGHRLGSPNQWDSSMPEYDPSVIPPEGLYQPVRGFGLAWRDARDAIGWATAPEFAFNLTYQCSVYRYHELNCYYQDPNGRIIGTDWSDLWRVVQR